ncbi:unnamed protein product [Cunninghamella blakesleeana]
MDEYQNEYLDWKTKNEALIESINRIEQEIDQTQNRLFEKRCYTEYLKEREEKVRYLQQRIERYDELFKPLEQNTKTESESTLNKLTPPQQQQHRRKRREISEQLELTPELISRQIESIYRKNKALSSSSLSSIAPETSILSSSTLSTTADMLNRHHQHDYTNDRLQNNIQRLMKNYTSEQYFSLIEDLLKKEIERNDDTVHQFNIKMNEYKDNDNNNNNNSNKKESDKKGHLTEDQKLEMIARQQNERLQYIIELEQDAERWKNRTQIVEQQLRMEIEQKYSDPDVQTAYTNYVQSKATKAEAEAQLLFTNHYIDEMKKVSSMLKEKHKSIEHLDSDVHALQEKLDLKKEQAIHLHSENQERVKLIQESPKKIDQLLDDINKLQETLNSIKLSNDILTNEEVVPNNENPNEKLLNQVGYALNPDYELAPSHIVKRLEDQMFKHNLILSQKPSKLNNELEALVLSWNDELKEHGIILPEPSNEMDAIDTVAQAISKLKDHSDKDWEEFSLNQQKLLTNRLDSLKDVNKHIEDIEKLLNERDIIIKGKIGTDYTVQDRNLEEWFQLADDQV